jgi:chromosome segregation ATPase
MAREKSRQKEIKPMNLKKAEELRSKAISVTNEAKLEVEGVKEKKDLLNVEIATLESKKEQIEADILAINTEKTTKSVELDELRTKVKVESGKVADLDRQIEEKTKRLMTADTETVTELKADIEALTIQKQTTEAKTAKARADLVAAENSLVDAEIKVTEAKDKVTALNNELVAIRDTQIPELEAKKIKIEGDIRDLEIAKVQRAAESATSKSISMELIRFADRLKTLQEEIRQAEISKKATEDAYLPKKKELEEKESSLLEMDKSISSKISSYKRMTTKALAETAVDEKLNAPEKVE